AVSPEAGLQAEGEKDGTLTVEPLGGGPALRVPASGPDRMLDVLRFSPDGRMLAVADNHRMYVGSVGGLWEVAAGKGGRAPTAARGDTVRAQSPYTFALDFFPDGRTLVSTNGDGTARLWEVATGREVTRFVPHRHPRGYGDGVADCVVTSPDGRTFATWGSD